MSDLIERVAEAIYRSQEWDFASDEAFSDLTEGCKLVFLTAAQSAIEAMREPSEAMINNDNLPYSPGEMIGYWHTMIDAALSR